MAGQSGPTARDRVALHVLQVGAIAVVLAALPYKAFDLDRYFVPKELVVHICAVAGALLCLGVRKRITLAAVDMLLALFLAASLVSSVVAINHWAAERALAISVSGVLLFWVASTLRRAGLMRPLIVALAIAVVVGAATSLAQAYGVQTEYFSINRAPGGTFGNRNFVAHLAAIGTSVVVLVALTARPGFGSLFGGVGMAVLSAALVLSRSRGAWLAVIALAAPVALFAYTTRSRWMDARTMRRSLVLAIATVAGAVAAVVIPNRLEWKSDSPYLDSAAGLVNYKEGSGAGRLVQYSNSVRMTLAHPIVGVGPGNWPVVYPKFASRNDPSMSQDDGQTANPWPSSDWVAYLSERGVIGFGLLLLAMLGLVVRAVRDLGNGGHRTNGDSERVLAAIALVGTLVATAVVGAFDAVLMVGAPAFFVWTLAGALAPPASGGADAPDSTRSVGMLLVAVAGVIMIARSGAQIASMALYSSSTKTAVVAQAAQLDPGSYRVRVKLAQNYLARGDCTHARPQAHAAHSLFPSAGEPKREIAECGGK
ncbi:MAG TPA: O-antigen ligase family protein [Gemmatimonadaceae bacterium]|jgi:O-antigen ligase